jgi:hypothetical protein
MMDSKIKGDTEGPETLGLMFAFYIALPDLIKATSCSSRSILNLKLPRSM